MTYCRACEYILAVHLLSYIFLIQLAICLYALLYMVCSVILYLHIIFFAFAPVVENLFVVALRIKKHKVLLLLFSPFIKKLYEACSSCTIKGMHWHNIGKYTQCVRSGIFKAFLIDFLQDLCNCSICLLDRSHSCDP